MNWLDERGNFKEKKMKDCPKCGGIGEFYYCSVCGFEISPLDIRNELECTCNTCHGWKGYYTEKCERCNGEGKVEIDFFDEVDRRYDEIKHDN